MKKIKIGQIGVCHEHAAGKIISLRGRPDVFEIVGVVDDRATKAARFAGDDLKPYEGLKFMTEEELFKTPGLQAVTVETPNLELVPAALRCLERGLAMHMDKPGGDDLKLFSKLRKGVEDRKLPFQMGYMFRNNPAIRFCMKALKENWIGELFEIQACMSHNYGGEPYQEYMSSFKGGVMFNLGCHLIDFIVAMMGRPERVVPFLKSDGGFQGSPMNNCLAIMEYPHATASVRVSCIEVDGQSKRLLKICGTKGTFELSPLERFDGKPLLLNMTLSEGVAGYAAGSHAVDFGAQKDRYEEQLLELAKTVNGEMENPYSYEHDCLVQDVLLACSGCKKWRV